MTRTDYLLFKEQLKRQAISLHQHKLDAKEWQRSKVGSPVYGKAKDYLVYRAGHIFMSMIRGKTREQIESNFSHQVNPQYKAYQGLPTVRALEKIITELCDQFGFSVNCDENLRVIEVTQLESETHAIGA